MIQQFLIDHWGVELSGLVVFLVAAATSMPKPGTPCTWGTIYTWLYETIQSILPANRGGRPSSIAQPLPAAPTVVHEPIEEPKP
jgi:hypothetical protein